MAKKRAIKMPPMLFKAYQTLLMEADDTFKRFIDSQDTKPNCGPGCSECCHALYGLFPIEAHIIHKAIGELGKAEQKKIRQRAGDALERLRILQGLQDEAGDIRGKVPNIRLRCPFLSENRLCSIYRQRPIICRVYGMPLMIDGSVKICARASTGTEFRGLSYDMTGAQRELYYLSVKWLEANNVEDLDKAKNILSVPFVALGLYEQVIYNR